MRIMLLGYGVVGQSLLQIISSRFSDINNKYGIKPRIVSIVDRQGSISDPNGLDISQVNKIKKKYGSVVHLSKFNSSDQNLLDLIYSTDAEVLVEVTPTNLETGEPGLNFIKTALQSGKHVVTANKGPISIAMPALMELATYNNVKLLFSGSVGGGTPILNLAKKCLEGDEIISIEGILNGTTNYMLTEMTEKKISFQKALKNAQNLGYAEADPTMDIEGLDTAAKLVIIANWISGMKITLIDVEIEGFTIIDSEIISNAHKRNSVIKLIGKIDQKASVKPTEIPVNSPLCVGGSLNAVTFTTKLAGKQTITGPGAGGLETASAVLRDIIDIKKSIK